MDTKTPPAVKAPLKTQSNVKETAGTETEDRLQLLKSRLTIAKAWCKKPHKAWREWINEYNIEDFGDTEEIRDKVRIGYVFRKVESELPAIFDDQPDLFIKGRHPNTKDIEPLIEGTYDYLWDIQRLEEVIEDSATFFELIGMGFVISPWVTKTKKVAQMIQEPIIDETTGQPVVDPTTGQPAMHQVQQYLDVPIIDNPMAESQDPFKIFFSPETKFGPVMSSKNCPGYFIERVTTREEIKSRFNKDVDAGESLDLKDSDTEDEIDDEIEKHGDVVKDDLKRVTYYEYYGVLTEEAAKGIKDEDGQTVEWTYDQEYHTFFTKNEELKAEACPYESYPLFIMGNYGLANKFWKVGSAKYLIPLVQEYEMYRSQILEHTRKMSNPKTMVPTEADMDEKAFRDPRTGVIVKFANGVAPSYLSPAPLGREVEVGTNIVKSDLEQTSGQSNLGGGSNESTVKTPRGIQAFSEAADKNVRRKRKKIARVLRELIIFQFQQIAKYWKPEDNHTLAIMDGQGSQNVQVTQEVLQVLDGVNQMYNIDIEIESLSINKVQMRQDALNLWDLANQAPDIFNRSEVAKWMLQSGFSMKDGDRFLLTEEQRAAMMKPQPEQPKVNVSIKADATTPPGAALLENEGLLQQGQGQQTVIDNQVMNQVVGDNQQNQQMDQMQLQGDQKQAQAFTQAAFKGGNNEPAPQPKL